MHLAAAVLGCLLSFLFNLLHVCVCAHVWLILSGQVWRHSGRAGTGNRERSVTLITPSSGMRRHSLLFFRSPFFFLFSPTSTSSFPRVRYRSHFNQYWHLEHLSCHPTALLFIAYPIRHAEHQMLPPTSTYSTRELIS